jgi:methylamine dehydrogenase heavy chain
VLSPVKALLPALFAVTFFALGPAADTAWPSAPEANKDGSDAAPIVAQDPHGLVESVRPELGPHALWVGDRLFRHSTLFDGDSGQALGMVDITWTLGGVAPHTSHSRREVYVVEPVYDRGHRGERIDYVTIYDLHTLAVTGEIKLPTKGAEAGHGVALSALLDDERFLVVLNLVQSGSVTVVDLEQRRFAAEIPVAGCSLVYPTGPRSFGMLCGDGAALAITLADDGSAAETRRSEPFFDVVADPLSEKGARDGSRWLFASFDGYLHEVEFAGSKPSLAARWSLMSDRERADSWLVGGSQHLALHRDSRRLYSLVHQGGPGSHKDAGSEIWVYDLEKQARVDTFEIPALLPAFLRPVLGLEPGSLAYRALSFFTPSMGAHRVVVSQDDEPLLFLRHGEIGVIGVLDALDGRHLHTIEEAGMTGGEIRIP